MFANFLHSLLGGKLLRILFASCSPCSKELFIAGYRHRKGFCMFFPGFGKNNIEWGRQMKRLCILNEAAFVVVLSGYNGVEVGMFNDVPDNKIISLFETLVEVNGANERFKSISKG